ncbi:MAG TPA: 16S rRNA (cytosine(1402)-N(4))-methyltransferase RsmH [Phycisphaerales bacterium]|nr:16S rRNA (cytosine(1402)-N(4))-methyltransferase RsmH [Phycisphaerales bacterium]
MTDPPRHLPVLRAETLDLLAPRPGETALDCTAGLGGHAAELARRLGPSGTLVLCDLDPGNLEQARARVLGTAEPPRVVVLRGSFAEAPRRLVEQGLRADVVLADLGFSSNQVESAERGLSFQRDGPLDMRLDPSGPLTAADLVNTAPASELAQIIRELGEERHARAVAEKIVRERRAGPIQTTARLAALVRSVVGKYSGGAPAGIDHATRTFQALRLAVNDELGHLRALLDSLERAARTSGDPEAAPSWLAPGARVAIISFHSLEDRPVKQAFARLVEAGSAEPLTRRPVTASDAERLENPRSRSAKLRALRLVPSPRARAG